MSSVYILINYHLPWPYHLHYIPVDHSHLYRKKSSTNLLQFFYIYLLPVESPLAIDFNFMLWNYHKVTTKILHSFFLIFYFPLILLFFSSFFQFVSSLKYIILERIENWRAKHYYDILKLQFSGRWLHKKVTFFFEMDEIKKTFINP